MWRATYARPVARHVVKRISNPRLLRYMTLFTWQAMSARPIVTSYNLEIDMGDRTSMKYRLEYRYGMCAIDLGYSISIRLSTISIMVILDIDTGYGLMMWEMTVSIRSSPISIWDILSLWPDRTSPSAAASVSFSACPTTSKCAASTLL